MIAEKLKKSAIGQLGLQIVIITLSKQAHGSLQHEYGMDDNKSSE